ncbi:uncharacterized protein PHA67_013348 isoform 1-T2 [Liasis olivaceus]
MFPMVEITVRSPSLVNCQEEHSNNYLKHSAQERRKGSTARPLQLRPRSFQGLHPHLPVFSAGGGDEVTIREKREGGSGSCWEANSREGTCRSGGPRGQERWSLPGAKDARIRRTGWRRSRPRRASRGRARATHKRALGSRRRPSPARAELAGFCVARRAANRKACFTWGQSEGASVSLPPPKLKNQRHARRAVRGKGAAEAAEGRLFAEGRFWLRALPSQSTLYKPPPSTQAAAIRS